MGCLMELILNFLDVFLMVSLVEVNACVVGDYVCTDIRMKFNEFVPFVVSEDSELDACQVARFVGSREVPRV